MSEQTENQLKRDIKRNLILSIIAIFVGAISIIYSTLIVRTNPSRNYVSKEFVKKNYITKKEHEEQLIHFMDLIYSDTAILNKE